MLLKVQWRTTGCCTVYNTGKMAPRCPTRTLESATILGAEDGSIMVRSWVVLATPRASESDFPADGGDAYFS